jgi:hypothetical protein
VYNRSVTGSSFYVCDGPVCRWRARDLGLPPPARSLPCLGRCDAPAAALTVENEAPRPLLRELTIVRRGLDPEPAHPPGAQRGPNEPVLLRDLLLADQRELATARRRGAYRTLELLPADLAQLLATATGRWPAQARASVVIVADELRADGCFALRPILGRDPHAVLEGALLAAHAAHARHVVLELRREWARARQVVTAALAEAQRAELTGEVTVEISTSDDAAPAPEAGTLRIGTELAVVLPHVLRNGASWWQEHAPRLVSISGDVLHPGVYELPRAATVGDAVAAAGGVVDGVRFSTLGSFLADGVAHPAPEADQPAPSGLIVANARRRT